MVFAKNKVDLSLPKVKDTNVTVQSEFLKYRTLENESDQV